MAQFIQSSQSEDRHFVAYHLLKTTDTYSATGLRQLMNKKIVLVVDDNAVILKTISLALQKHDFNVVTALDGSEAVGAVRREKPDVIVLDLSFPPSFGNVEWDGFRIMQWLKRIEEAKNVPFVIITGGEAAKYKERALKEGAAAFFQKPVNNEELVNTIQNLMGIGKSPVTV